MKLFQCDTRREVFAGEARQCVPLCFESLTKSFPLFLFIRQTHCYAKNTSKCEPLFFVELNLSVGFDVL